MDNNFENNTVVQQKKSAIPMISLILGIVGFFFNPLWIFSGVAIGLGIAGLVKKLGKGLSIAGLCVGIASLLAQMMGDFLITLCTMGLGFFVFFF
ncbi:MAG: hypothetical protein E7621_06315 [Ruminococcaceae bacterium]|nr:hypothetical protein [Oscillospiraceae bacterium]